MGCGGGRAWVDPWVAWLGEEGGAIILAALLRVSPSRSLCITQGQGIFSPFSRSPPSHVLDMGQADSSPGLGLHPYGDVAKGYCLLLFSR